MKKAINFLKIFLFLFLLACLFSCSKKTRDTQKTQFKKVETLEFKGQSQKLTTKTIDTVLHLAGSAVKTSFTPRPFNPALEADSLDSTETENDLVKVKTVVNKKTGKITTQAEAKAREVPIKAKEEIIENSTISGRLESKLDSTNKTTARVTEPSPVAIESFMKPFVKVCVLLLVVAALYLGLRFYFNRRSANKPPPPWGL